MENKYCKTVEINNENEKYTLDFIFHTNILHIKSSRIPVMQSNVNITYQVIGRQHIKQTSYMIIYQNEYIQIYIDYLIE